MMKEEFPRVPKTWEEFVELRSFMTDCNVLFLRREEDQIKYKKETDSMSRTQVLKRITDQIGSDGIALLPCKYPHTNVLQNFPKAMHYCLWSMDGALEDVQIKKEVNKMFPNKIWTNMTRSEGKFSIPEIWHTHIYIYK